MKKLVVYFSHRGENYNVGILQEGNAEHIAKVIQRLTGADIYEIEPVRPYSSSYRLCVQEAVAEAKKQAKPEIKNPLKGISEYDTIYLCYPNWCGTFPRIVATFLESFDFSGKQIYPMCTHEGSGLGHSIQDLEQMLPNSQIHKGLAIKGTDARESDGLIKMWLNA